MHSIQNISEGVSKVTDVEVQRYIDNPHQFMLLPEFVATFANGTKAPWIIRYSSPEVITSSSPEATQFGEELCEKVRQWVKQRIAKNESSIVK